MLFVLLTIKWKMKTKNIVNKPPNNIVSEYKKKIYKEYLLPNNDVLQIHNYAFHFSAALLIFMQLIYIYMYIYQLLM